MIVVVIAKPVLNAYVVNPAKLTTTWNEEEVIIEFGFLMLVNLILILFPAFNWLTINPTKLSAVVPLAIVTVGEVAIKDP